MDPNQPINPNQPPVQPGPQPIIPPQAPGQVIGTPTSQPAQQQPYPQQTYPNTPPQAPINQYNNQYPTPKKSKKKLLLIIVPVIVAVGIVALLLFSGAKQIVNKVAGLELENYSNSNFAFSMQVPKGWSPEERNEEFSKEVSFQEPVGDVKDQSEANKHYARIKVDYKLADKDYLEKSEQEYFDGIKKGLQRLLSDKNKENTPSSDYVPESAAVESEEMTTANGLKAYKVKLKVTNFYGEKDSIGYEYGLFVFVDKKNQYELNVRAHESESLNSKVDSILTSFAKK